MTKSGRLPKSCRVVSVFGPFANRALVEMTVDTACELFGGPITSAVSPTRVIDAVEADLAKLEERWPGVTVSGLAQAAVALAYELDNPYNSATSKGQCAKALMEALDRLRELAPAEEEKDGLDELGTRRAARLAGGAGT